MNRLCSGLLRRFDIQHRPASAATHLQSGATDWYTTLHNGHVMTPQCSTFWPLEDVGINGHCYGWVLSSRLICVAGVLQVGSRGGSLLLRFPTPSY
jgi:hypothetical protein